ncbi:YdbL family protein [Oceanospirillum sp.]|uniref:YdbL family protein n=1 Tax=Oceanospirillum sp. TaxID=2021254 RepID=UPI003A917E4F
MNNTISNNHVAPRLWVSSLTALMISLLLALVMAGPAYALDLDAAKDSGWVGERYTGYLGVVQPEAGVKALVDDVNNKRTQVYKDLAAKNKITLQEVEKIAGKKVIEKTRPGNLIDLGNGWLKK